MLLGAKTANRYELLAEIARLRAELSKSEASATRGWEMSDSLHISVRDMRMEAEAQAARAETAEIERDRLRADLEQSQSEHRHTLHVMDGMQEEIVKLSTTLDLSSALIEGYERDIENLRAARLRPETATIAKRALAFYYDRGMELPPAFRGNDYDVMLKAIEDLSRAYPEEE